MMLSNDNNLCVKAMVHNVAVLQRQELPDPDDAEGLIQEMLQLPEPQLQVF